MVERALRSKKRVFWEALLIAILVFGLGIIAGVAYENYRFDQMEEYFAKSEVSLIDSLAMKDLLSSGDESLSCDMALKHNVDFADKIYNESLKLASYQESNKVTDELRITHSKYDALRTQLWMANKDLRKRCDDYSYAVYLYNYSAPTRQEQAENDVWSKVLYDFKQEEGNDLVLIPIAANNELGSLEVMMSNYDTSDLPVVILNDEHAVHNLQSVDQLQNLINQSSNNQSVSDN